jgi:hypothetical protein
LQILSHWLWQLLKICLGLIWSIIVKFIGKNFLNRGLIKLINFKLTYLNKKKLFLKKLRVGFSSPLQGKTLESHNCPSTSINLSLIVLTFLFWISWFGYLRVRHVEFSSNLFLVWIKIEFLEISSATLYGKFSQSRISRNNAKNNEKLI